MTGTSEYKNNWQKEHFDRINLTVRKGDKGKIQAHAAACSESVAGFINRAIQETMERDYKSAESTALVIEAAMKYEKPIEDMKELVQLAEAVMVLEPILPDIRVAYDTYKANKTRKIRASLFTGHPSI